MPIYEYECPKCGKFEFIQKVSDKPLKLCPTCQEKGKKEAVTKSVSASSFVLKGTGWYKTDYSSGSNAGNGKGSGKKSNNVTNAEASTTGGSTDTKSTESAPTKSSESKTATSAENSGKKCGSGCGCH